MKLRDLTRDEPGRGRSDLTPLLTDAPALGEAIARMAEAWREEGVEKVAALDSMGFVFGGALARELGVGLVLLRKRGKAAWRSREETYTDYSGEEKTLVLTEDAVRPGERVLLVDDWCETGAGLRAARRLVEAEGAVVVGAAVLHADEQADLGDLTISAAFDRDAD